ncbi:hypothetical protein SeMB42_g02809 [Synchytrium endobioticum]|uniref:Uncharacterized protein n=1 Tax=Synchytrium endobioticum TaxID=286115 RepID=A0A507DB74_9FUNG|nr:hypothetical protein SeMB42_g02809 [Synchytrium endobioticum]
MLIHLVLPEINNDGYVHLYLEDAHTKCFLAYIMLYNTGRKELWRYSPTDPPELFAFLRGRIEANIFSEISDSLYTQDDLFEMPADGMTTERVDSVRNFHCAVDVRLKLLYGVLRRYLHDDEGSNVNIVLENARDLLLAHMKTHCDVERAYVLYFSGLKHGLINHELPHFRRKSVDSYDNESEYIESVRGRAVSERRYYYLLSVEPR